MARGDGLAYASSYCVCVCVCVPFAVNIVCVCALHHTHALFSLLLSRSHSLSPQRSFDPKRSSRHDMIVLGDRGAGSLCIIYHLQKHDHVVKTLFKATLPYPQSGSSPHHKTLLSVLQLPTFTGMGLLASCGSSTVRVVSVKRGRDRERERQRERTERRQAQPIARQRNSNYPTTKSCTLPSMLLAAEAAGQTECDIPSDTNVMTASTATKPAPSSAAAGLSLRESILPPHGLVERKKEYQ